jgi:hypothetical protein
MYESEQWDWYLGDQLMDELRTLARGLDFKISMGGYQVWPDAE